MPIRIMPSLPGKLVWVMVGMLVAAFVVWQLRRLWLHFHPEKDKRIKFSRRLARRLRNQRLAELENRPRQKSRGKKRQVKR